MISYVCQMQEFTCGAWRICELGRQVNSHLRPNQLIIQLRLVSRAGIQLSTFNQLRQ
jgi:hypothetical protein